MKTIEDALRYADTFDSPGNQHMSIVMLAAEVRRLRIDYDAMNQSLDLMREENERLRKDADRIDWLADVNNTIGSVVLPRHIVEQNISSLRQAIDAARGGK